MDNGKIIDFRLRPDTRDFLSIVENPVFKSYAQGRGYNLSEGGIETLVKKMDDNGISYGVVQGRDIEVTFNWKFENDAVAGAMKESGGRLIGFAGVDPNKGMDAVRELVRCKTMLGLVGAAMDPYMHKLPPSDRMYYPIFAKAIELDMPVVLTTGWAYRMPGVSIYDASPEHVDRVATDFPELKVILSHGGYPFIREAVTVAYRHENVYLEWSGMENKLGSNEYVEAANSLIGDKMLFASAYPFIELADAIETYRSLGFTDDVFSKVMSGNAQRLLGLDAT